MTEDNETAESSPRTDHPPPFTAAERMRRHRERKGKGLRWLWIELREAEIENFIRRKRLAPEDRASPAAIRQCLYSISTSTTPSGDAPPVAVAIRVARHTHLTNTFGSSLATGPKQLPLRVLYLLVACVDC